MSYINTQLLKLKVYFENAIEENGLEGKKTIIRSSKLINLIHDAVKQELINAGTNPINIQPNIGKSSPELKVTGFFKQKKQDICILPTAIPKIKTPITWGPLAYENIKDRYGDLYTERTLAINVRSQMSSLGKNYDTLFERTYAEAMNLHTRLNKMVLGEVYLVPTHAYDSEAAKAHSVEFIEKQTNIVKYISFFSTINNRTSSTDDLYKYERCALLIVDFRQCPPKLYDTTEALISDGLIPNDFPLRIEDLSLSTFAINILAAYNSRFPSIEDEPNE